MSFEASKVNEVKLSDNPIQASMVLPFFNAKNIAFVAFESLIKQEGVDFKWELIIIEEDNKLSFGLDNILKYKDQLKDVGCARIIYYSIKHWMPLGAKWHYLFQSCHKDSEVVFCSSADIHQSKHRLKRQFDILKTGEYNWHKISGNIVYDIETGCHLKIMLEPGRTDTCCQAMRLDLARKFPLNDKAKNVDGFRYRTLEPYGINFYYDTSDLWKDTVNVNGINNISKHRQERILTIQPPLEKCCDSMLSHIPKDILLRLRNARKHLL